jgi:hypothetical protein
MHEDIVDCELARDIDIMAAVFNREGEHSSYDTKSLLRIIILECSVLDALDTDKPAQLT